MKYSESLKYMLLPYVVLALLWVPMSQYLSDYDDLMNQLIMDLFGTFFIFGVSFHLRNSSVYDIYWHIVPMYFVGYWSYGIQNFWVPFLCFFYCNKQNFNYFRYWPGFQYEDFRYKDAYKWIKNPFLYWLYSLVGFHIVPTFMVFFGYLPIYYVLTSNEQCNNLIYYIGVFIGVGAIIIEMVADHQLFPYRIGQKKGNCDVGLWAYSRHPNYFGECMFWWALYILGLSYGVQYWWTSIGALSIQALFHGYSIHAMEQHLVESRSSYKDYQKKVNAFVPWFPKSIKN
ncbi:hypothetical protein pb186bvf_010932 [Paramecium bursaria]